MKTGSTFSLLSETDLYLFNEGNHYKLYDRLGAHPVKTGDGDGVYFAVWAPNAREVSVTGDFNDWNRDSHRLRPRGVSGIWDGVIKGVPAGSTYKYYIVSQYNDYRVEKADPFAFFSETPPKTASIVWDLEYTWNDSEWMRERHAKNRLDVPVSIYEVHLGSWRRVPEEDNRPLTYREIAPRLARYVNQLGFTHVEFLPVMEHPFYGSWGYQTTGYFAPTGRYGTPQDLMYLIDYLHRYNIGVILDWVPSHFPDDPHALGFFDGTHLYEHKNPVQGIHPDWNSYLFNYDRNEVRSFLKSSALFWLEKYHADGLRMDAVASILYLDYGRKEGEWIPNKDGGRENLGAVAFLKQLNEIIYAEKPDVQTIAEESTAWPMVSRPTYAGGLGFGLKWDMGWMHDTLVYMTRNPIYRSHHQNDLTFRMVYAFSENYTLPLSHDEVVHGKASLLSKMPGDEWSHEDSLEWHLLEYPPHSGVQEWVTDLNWLYRDHPALYEFDCDPAGFDWIDTSDHAHSIISFIRRGHAKDEPVVVVCNFTPETHFRYDIGVPLPGTWEEILNSDDAKYGGSGQSNHTPLTASDTGKHSLPHSITLTIPPLAVIFLKKQKPVTL